MLVDNKKRFDIEGGQLIAPDGIPDAIAWLGNHAFENLGGERARSVDDVVDIAVIAYAFVKIIREEYEKNSITVTWPDGSKVSFAMLYFSDENADEMRASFADKYREEGGVVTACMPEELPPRPIAEFLMKYLTIYHPTPEHAEKRIAEIGGELIKARNIRLKELFFAVALTRLQDAIQSLDEAGNWTVPAIEHYSEAAAAAAIGSGEAAWRMTMFRGDILKAKDHGKRGGEAKAKKVEPLEMRVLELWGARRNLKESKRHFALRVQGEIVELARSLGLQFEPANAVRRIGEIIARRSASSP